MADAIAPILSMVGFFVIFIWLIWFVVVIGALVFWIFMIVDVAKREFPKSDDKIVWVLIVVLTNLIGALIYFFMVKQKDKK